MPFGSLPDDLTTASAAIGIGNPLLPRTITLGPVEVDATVWPLALVVPSS